MSDGRGTGDEKGKPFPSRQRRPGGCRPQPPAFPQGRGHLCFPEETAREIVRSSRRRGSLLRGDPVTEHTRRRPPMKSLSRLASAVTSVTLLTGRILWNVAHTVTASLAEERK